MSSDPFGNFSDDDLFDESADMSKSQSVGQTGDVSKRSQPGSRRHSKQFSVAGHEMSQVPLSATMAYPGVAGMPRTASYSSATLNQYPHQPYSPVIPHSGQMTPMGQMGYMNQTSSRFGTMTGEVEYYVPPPVSHHNSIASSPQRTKGVTFKESEPEYPANAYSPRKQLLEETNQYELERFDTYDTQGNPNPNLHHSYMRPYSTLMTFTGDDYMINPLEDADDDDDIDPFGDDDSLFSETGEEIVRRGTTIKRNGTLNRRGTIRSRKDGTVFHDDEDDFQPRLNYTKTIKKAKLVNGNYVIDAPVPKALLDTFGRKINDGGREMAFVRYSAVTCGPSNFIKYNYNLRQELYSPPRETEIMVCITMYNEDEILLGRTLLGVFENIKNLTKRADPVWGEDSWKKIVVCIVNDGRMELNKRTETLLAALGIFQDGYAKSKINNKAVRSHLYEYTTTVGIDSVNDRVHLCNNSTPVQMMFCLKEKNGRKINSHRWCFQAFAPIVNPRVIMLLDCGTKPAKDAFYYLWRSFRDPRVAGACGEMKASLGVNRKLLANPLVAAQNFEYKISNILDKPMESVFGFISVLPGAFSAYRWEALLNVDGEGPLEKYFKGEYLHQSTQVKPKKKKKDVEPEGDNLFDANSELHFALLKVEEEEDEDDEREIKERNFHEAGIFTSNMYLAEDRILCFELVAKKGHDYVLKYVNEAKAETDVPEAIDDFVLQRRRWLNGSLFAAVYAVVHWTKIWKSNHSLLRKLWFQLEFYYQLVTIIVSWFSIASFFLVFRILTANLGSSEMNFNVGKYLAVIFLWLYVGSVVTTFVLAFGNTPRGTKKFYMALTVFFAVMMAYMMFAAIYLAVHTVTQLLHDHKDDFSAIMVFTNQKFRDLVVSVVSTYILYFVGAFLYGEPSFMVTSFAQYVLLSPTYVNVLNIYAFANIHDVSWGNRDVPQAKDLGAAKSTGNDKDEMVMIVPGLSDELDETYMNNIESLRVAPIVEDPIVHKKQKDDAYYAFIRTMTVLIWMLTNAILIAIVLEAAGLDKFTKKKAENADGSIAGNSEIFLSIILWIVAGLAAFRFVGCVLYLIFKAFRPIKWKWIARRQLKKVATT
jgi:chitin synthase